MVGRAGQVLVGNLAEQVAVEDPTVLKAHVDVEYWQRLGGEGRREVSLHEPRSWSRLLKIRTLRANFSLSARTMSSARQRFMTAAGRAEARRRSFLTKPLTSAWTCRWRAVASRRATARGEAAAWQRSSLMQPMNL